MCVLNISTECIDRAYITRTYVHATHFSLVFPPFSHAGWADDAAIMTGGRPSIVNQTYLLCKAHTAFWQKFIQIQSPTHSPCCSPSGTPLPLPSQGPSMLSLPMNACIYACMKNTLDVVPWLLTYPIRTLSSPPIYELSFRSFPSGSLHPAENFDGDERCDEIFRLASRYLFYAFEFSLSQSRALSSNSPAIIHPLPVHIYIYSFCRND